MKKEEAFLALYDLGCSTEEIDELIRIERIRRKAITETCKKGNIADIIKHIEL